MWSARLTSAWVRQYIRDRGGAMYILERLGVVG